MNGRRPALARLWLLVAVVAAVTCLIAGGLAVPLVSRRLAAGAVAQSAPAESQLPRRVHALGRLEPAGKIRRLGAPTSSNLALVEELLVEEGDDVAAGEVLARLDHYPHRQAALMEAEAKLAEARARLAQVLAGSKAGDIEAQRQAVTLLDAQQEYAKRELDRAQEVYERNALPIENLDQKKWAFERLGIERQRAAQTLASLEEVRSVDVEFAQQQVAAAEAALLRHRAELAACEVRAPLAGRVLKIHIRAGEPLAGQGLLDLGDVAHMEAVAEVFEGDLAGIKLGQRAQLKLDSSEQLLTGTVSQLGQVVARKSVLTNDPISDTDARVVEVRVRLDAGSDPLVQRLSNARVEVTIELTADAEPATGGDPSADEHSAPLAGRASRPEL